MKIQFWFEFASTYSYLSVARIAAVGKAAEVEIEWQPFLLGPIFKNQGLEDSPFNLNPAKGAYMWRDMERLCENYRLPFKRPSQFPRNGLLAARVATLGRGKSWLPDFTRAVFHANFADDADISNPSQIGDILSALALPVDETLEQAHSDKNKAALKDQTTRAIELGIFGAPSFIANTDLFWGNDRLEDALVSAQTTPKKT